MLLPPCLQAGLVSRSNEEVQQERNWLEMTHGQDSLSQQVPGPLLTYRVGKQPELEGAQGRDCVFL